MADATRRVFRDATLLAGKDLRLEAKSRVGLAQVLPFGVLVLVVMAFALDAERRAQIVHADRVLRPGPCRHGVKHTGIPRLRIFRNPCRNANAENHAPLPDETQIETGDEVTDNHRKAVADNLARCIEEA